VDGIGLVVHFDPPTEAKAYLHRSGRTARAGAAGTVITLVLPEQATEVAGLQRRAGVVAA
jgi:superfamily II DNA/RNA helicase